MEIRWMNEYSKQFLEQDYLLPGQTVENRLQVIGDTAEKYLKQMCKNPEDRVKFDGYSQKLQSYIAKGWISMSTPIWTNFGTSRGLPISCFNSHFSDSVSEILETNCEIGMMTKTGGGTSGYFGEVRSRGSVITGNGSSNGTYPFLEYTQSTTSIISQGSTRRGYFAGYQDIFHPDIEEWCKIRSEGDPIQQVTWGVCVPTWWVNSMREGDVTKRKLWAKIIQKRFETGLPYIFYNDNVNNGESTPEIYKNKNIIKSSNLCVSPNTQILTSNGYQCIGELENQSIDIWNGEEFSTTKVIKTGENQQLYRVTTNSGHELDCTEYHKWYILESTAAGLRTKPSRYNEVRTLDLKEGDKLIKFDLPIIEGDIALNKAYTNGFFSGDGCCYKGNNIIYLYNEKRKLLPFIEHDGNQAHQEKRIVLNRVKDLKEKFFVPDCSYTIDSRLEWLAGYLDADGTVTNDNGSQTIQATSIEKEFLKEIQLMLQTLGVVSKVTFGREAGEYMLPANNGTGENKLFKCNEISRLLINGNSLFKLIQLGFKCNRLVFSDRKPNRECSQFTKIKSIEKLKTLSDTFCFTEPKRHMGMFNGILTGNCTEVMLPSDKNNSFVCDLGSMVDFYYDEWKHTDCVEVLVQLLDAAMEEFIEKASKVKFLEKAVNFAKNHRALGIGRLGYHTLLKSKMIPFEGLEARYLNIDIQKTIKDQSYSASEYLASIFGKPTACIETNRRHGTLIAIAPTTSSAFIMQIFGMPASQSTEPTLSNFYIKDLAKGKFIIKDYFLSKLLESKDKNKPEIWDSIMKQHGSVLHLDFLSDFEKSVFKTAREISQKEILLQASQRQKFIDQGQSINLFVTADTTPKEVNELLLYAHDIGIKSLYYQHNVSAASEFAKNFNNCINCE